MYVCIYVGEYVGLTGEKLRGKEVVAAGLATHYVPSQVSLSFSFSSEIHHTLQKIQKYLYLAVII